MCGAKGRAYKLCMHKFRIVRFRFFKILILKGGATSIVILITEKSSILTYKRHCYPSYVLILNEYIE